MMKLKQPKTDLAQPVQVETRRRFVRQALLLGMATPALATVFGSKRAVAKSTDQALLTPEAPSVADSRPGALASLSETDSRRLHLVNSHTGDNVNLVYFTHGIYIEQSLEVFNHLMRDRRANVATDMDISLYDQLFLLRSTLKTDAPVHVLSGYRTPETNAKLRRRSSGVAKYSLHMEGRAADIYVPGISTKRVQKTALSLKAGGVGIYSKSGFVHVDTGQVRHWGK